MIKRYDLLYTHITPYSTCRYHCLCYNYAHSVASLAFKKKQEDLEFNDILMTLIDV